MRASCGDGGRPQILVNHVTVTVTADESDARGGEAMVTEEGTVPPEAEAAVTASGGGGSGRGADAMASRACSARSAPRRSERLRRTRGGSSESDKRPRDCYWADVTHGILRGA